ncbi:MAG: phosphoadenosine phosphosulfate reductase family protein, partial [Proteiniphilum sp.]|nr:phosphoadenosine phosphosulfate reductase family protein [Proteiniphilum sp.]
TVPITAVFSSNWNQHGNVQIEEQTMYAGWRLRMRRGRRLSAWILGGKMSFEAQDLIEQAIKRHGDRICVNWSGGRDSTAVLHMALKINPRIKVIFGNTRCESGETWAYIRKLYREWEINLFMTTPEKTFWQCADEYGLPKVRNSDSDCRTPKCCYFLKEKPIDDMKKRLGVTAYFTGLMKDESHQRFLTLSRYDRPGQSQDEISFCAQRYYKKSTNEWAYHPIANWSSEDIDRYFKENDLPVNQFYVKWGGIYKRSGCLLCTAYLSWENKLKISHPYAYKRLKARKLAEQENRFHDPGKLGMWV